MTKKSVQTLLEDIRLVSEQNYEIVKAVRVLVIKTFETRPQDISLGSVRWVIYCAEWQR